MELSHLNCILCIFQVSCVRFKKRCRESKRLAVVFRGNQWVTISWEKKRPDQIWIFFYVFCLPSTVSVFLMPCS
ncbi:hypothetical protein BCR42DRAFT_423372 [Absidia repens]|uniref:Uncharacterized protein n=1 Tax=Absidia repens TaxID=90262 RepID=A0A1X2I5S4_9FUNG|nr:hypothetical protein BCR42DRAFT_423372 [Absidia repens]